MRSCIISLLLLFICQNFRLNTSSIGPNRDQYNKKEHFRGPSRKVEHAKGEPSKAGASKGDSSDENLDPARSKRHAIKRYAANARKMNVYVGELKVSYQNHTQNSINIWNILIKYHYNA